MSTSVTAEQLIGLNREIAALVRAGVPLETGLRHVGGSGLGISQRLSDRMAQGASLSAAMEAEGTAVPRAYLAIVAAGQRSGRLPEALEAVANLAEEMQELRRRARLATIYPLMIGVLAYALLLVFLVYLLPQFQHMFNSLRLPEGRALMVLSRLHDSVGVWGPAIPIALLVVMSLEWIKRHSAGGDLLLNAGLFDWFPGVSRIRSDLRRGWFCQLLAALVDHQTPLPEALELAGDAVGTGPMARSAHELAAELRTGQSLTVGLSKTPAFSPLLRWMMSSGEAGGDLPAALRRGSQLLRSQARVRMQLFHTLVPIATVIVIGGGAAMVYGLAVFGPLVELLDRLTWEPFH
ncbi:MAG: type II secretion system F family protein [Planctomycetaceae bacterium]